MDLQRKWCGLREDTLDPNRSSPSCLECAHWGAHSFSHETWGSGEALVLRLDSEINWGDSLSQFTER